MKKLWLLILLLALLIVIASVFPTLNEGQMGSFIFFYLRLPRIWVALLSGAALATSGAVLQGYFRNPLADPSILGTSSLAALGAILAVYTGFSTAFPVALPLLAMAFSFLMPLVFLKQTKEPFLLILTGMGLSGFINALISLLLNMLDKDYALLDIIFWMFGSFADHTWEEILLITPPSLLGISLLLKSGSFLDQLAFGDDMAKVLGQNISKNTVRILVGVCLAVGPVVALSGIVGFIGLIVPHIMRLWISEVPSRLLFPSLVGGSFLALLSDFTTKILPTHGELKVGVVTALIGAPFFIHLLLKSRHARV